MSALRPGLVAAVCLVAVLLALPGQEPGSGIVAAVAVAAAGIAAFLPAGHAPGVVLVALVYEAGLAFPRDAGPVARLLIGVGLAVMLWLLHSGYALAAPTVGAGAVPPAAARRFARTSVALLLTAAPGVVVLSTLAVALALPADVTPLVRVLGLAGAAGLCALPLWRSRSRP